jgi:hypothetical protein
LACLRTGILAFLLLFPSLGFAEGPDSIRTVGEVPFTDQALAERLAAQPGTQATRNKAGEIIELVRGGVSVGQMVSIDNSGHGAVLCAWEILIETRNELDSCGPGHRADLRNALDQEIDDINRFIVLNSLDPVTLEQVKAGIASLTELYRQQLEPFSPDMIKKECMPGGKLGQFLSAYDGITVPEQRKAIEDLLSVPRPPVMNPCL